MRRRTDASRFGRVLTQGTAFVIALVEAASLQARPVAPDGVRLNTRNTPEPTGDAYQSGRGLLAAGDVTGALAAFRQAVVESPQSVDALNGLAVCYDRLGRYDVSRNYYDAALAVDPASATVLNNLGYSLFLQGEFQAAIPVLQRAMAGADPSVTAASQRVLNLVGARIREDSARAGAAIARAEITNPGARVELSANGEQRLVFGGRAPDRALVASLGDDAGLVTIAPSWTARDETAVTRKERARDASRARAATKAAATRPSPRPPTLVTAKASGITASGLTKPALTRTAAAPVAVVRTVAKKPAPAIAAKPVRAAAPTAAIKVTAAAATKAAPATAIEVAAAPEIAKTASPAVVYFPGDQSVSAAQSATMAQSAPAADQVTASVEVVFETADAGSAPTVVYFPSPEPDLPSASQIVVPAAPVAIAIADIELTNAAPATIPAAPDLRLVRAPLVAMAFTPRIAASNWRERRVRRDDDAAPTSVAAVVAALADDEAPAWLLPSRHVAKGSLGATAVSRGPQQNDRLAAFESDDPVLNAFAARMRGDRPVPVNDNDAAAESTRTAVIARLEALLMRVRAA